MSDLTVRINVRLSSPQRRQMLPENDGEPKTRVGTGYVIDHPCQEKKYSSSSDRSMLKSITKYVPGMKRKTKGVIYIQTSQHLVFNDEEAQSAYVEFFYNTPDRSNVVILTGNSMLASTTPGDAQCLLVCSCSDISFVQKLNSIQQQFHRYLDSLPEKIKKGMYKKLFMIHHPHGGPKMLSYGDYIRVKYRLNLSDSTRGKTSLVKVKAQDPVLLDTEIYRKLLLYAVDTCPGSCGAPILTYLCRSSDTSGNLTLKPDIWMHSGVETSHKLGASVLKGCSADDFIKLILQEEPHLEEDSDNEDNLGNQKVNSPVFKVISKPSYPEYTLYQKRLSSYNEVCSINHILQPNFLAASGFFYESEADSVRCFQCGLGLRPWKDGDDINVEHKKKRPDCPYFMSLTKEQEDNTIQGARANLGLMTSSPTDSFHTKLLKLLKVENRELKNQLKCKICSTADIKDVFLPCGELYACSNCSKLLTHCPSCSNTIMATITVYLT